MPTLPNDTRTKVPSPSPAVGDDDAGHSQRASPLTDQLRRLRAVAAVCAQGSVAAAASLLHLSQPAVTRAIREIETVIGLPLFERAARGMLPTRAGRLVGGRTQRALAELMRGAAEANGVTIDTSRAARAMRPERFAAMVAARSLDSFVAIEVAGSEPRAARRLGISQPAVNRNLRELEHLAGTPLLQRTTRGTRLTASGEALLRHVKLALAELRSAEDELASFTGRLRGRVVVGTLPLSTSYLVPHAVERLLGSHADLQVTVVDGTYDALVEKLRCAEVDVIVGALRADAPTDLAQEPLFEDTLAVIARAGHPITAARPMRLATLHDQPWIVPLPGTPARAAFERAFAAMGLSPPRASVQTNSAAVVRSMLTETDRLALLSLRQVVSELRSGLLVTLPVEDLAVTSRSIGVTTRADGAPTPGAAALLAALREESLAKGPGEPMRVSTGL